MGDYEHYIELSRYARYLDDEKRRETWSESVDRYMTHVVDKAYDWSKAPEVEHELWAAITNKDVLPSMRAIMTAGPALERDNVAGYNCSYAPVDHPRAFDEALYILMCGTGFGYSVERQYVSKLPDVPELNAVDSTIVVEDSKRGWAKALRKLVGALYSGDVPSVDYSHLRPHGARLKTFGGRASGPEPLRRLLDFVIATFKEAQGRKLTSYEAHRIMCKIGESVVSGGVRRSALISLSNLSDDRMRRAKQGQWWEKAPELALANNSVAYTEKPDFPAFLEEWHELFKSYAGERGIFYRGAADRQVAKNRRRETGHQWGTNPCSEIILRPHQFCNLSSVVIRPEDTLRDLLRKVELATILGTIQATLTEFEYLRPIWKKNAEEERLLGVSLTGVMDHEVLREVGEEAKTWLTHMRAIAIATNEKWSKILGINQAAAVTCIKPEGTVSQLADTSSGLHPRYSRFYVRRVTGDLADPLTHFMMQEGIPWEQKENSPNEILFSFPMRSPDSAVLRHEVSALQQMEHWKMMQDYWCEHKPSITVYYKPEEFLSLGQWVWDHFEDISGVAFLPYDNGTYVQAPYEEIDEEKYNRLKAMMPKVDWTKFGEETDNTTGVQMLACSSGSCEIL